MLLGIIPAVAGYNAYNAVTQFMGMTASKEVLDSSLTDEQKAAAIAYQNGINPKSKFQKTGEGWFSDYSQIDNSQLTEQNTTNVYNLTESPNSQITTTTDQTAKQESTQTAANTDPLSNFLGSLGGTLGGSIPLVIALCVGGYLILKELK